MNIQEVSDILGVCRFLRAPKHVFITDEPVYEERNGKAFYRGLQPKNRRDVIFLSAQSDVTTIPHEAWHAMTGLGELSAYPVGRIVAAKYELIKNFPRLKAFFSRRVEYQRSEGSEEFPRASRYRDRVEHYVLASKP
ncbi:unnamed protein product [marine sediment metagenome]|uniref:Uncharacterized protein n=1 Tax=marine sediment metagenome TaxID=412755 RepID=X1I6U0_9ZZZZ